MAWAALMPSYCPGSAHSSVSAFPGSAADVWGFTDLNTNREYAIITYNIGTAVFDVTDPENPVEVGFVDGQNTSWRDVKVTQAFNADGKPLERLRVCRR